MSVTIKDVAKKAGVSLSTVSLVLNEKKNVSEQTRLKVLKAITALDFHPRRAARGLASKRSGNIGFILTEDHFSRAEPFYTKIFLGTEFESRQYSYYVLLTTVNKIFQADQHIPRFLLERNVDGVILAGSIPFALIDYIHRTKLPVVFIDFLPKSGPCSAVLIDNFDGAYQAVTYLIQQGHKRIAFMAGDLEHPSLRERFEGYKRALEAAGVDFDDRLTVTNEPFTAFQDGYEAAQKLLSRHVSFSAIFAGNDAMAQGCMRFLRENNIDIPGKVSVVGFDDIESDVHVEPHLTTIRVNKEEMGAIAVQKLVQSIESETPKFEKILLPIELVIRSSTQMYSG